AKCSVFLNHVDQAKFYPHPRTRTDDRIIMLFPATIQWHQGLDIAIQALARVREMVPNAKLHPTAKAAARVGQGLRRLSARLGLNGSVRFFGSVPLDRIPDLIANADIGIVPKRADSFGNEACSTKIMEFMSQGVPVVVSRTKVDTFYHTEDDVRFFPSGNPQAMADAIMEVITRPDLRDSLIAHGHEYVRTHAWERRKKDYLDLVDHPFPNQASPPSSGSPSHPVSSTGMPFNL